MEIEKLCETAIGAAIAVHRSLGPGLLESAYQKCLGIELEARGVPFSSEVTIPISYRGVIIEPAYRADFVVDGQVIIEVKCVSKVEPIHKAQLLTYLRLTQLPIGLLLNFNNPTLKEGIVRMRL
jgi:GxxExxY protein